MYMLSDDWTSSQKPLTVTLHVNITDLTVVSCVALNNSYRHLNPTLTLTPCNNYNYILPFTVLNTLILLIALTVTCTCTVQQIGLHLINEVPLTLYSFTDMLTDSFLSAWRTYPWKVTDKNQWLAPIFSFKWPHGQRKCIEVLVFFVLWFAYHLKFSFKY